MNKRIVAFYADSLIFSGQRFAIELVVGGLRNKKWDVKTITIPALNRVSTYNLITLSITLLPRVLISWIKILLSINNRIIFLGLGQTKLALIREGFPLIYRILFNAKSFAVISLNGSNFMKWGYKSFEANTLRFISRAAKYITVVGPTQKEKMIELGLPNSKVIIMDNTCSLEPLSESEILQKHYPITSLDSNKPIKILFLSSLIEQKGYIDFVEAISDLSSNYDIRIDATLCGRITIGRSDDVRFKNTNDASEWLAKKINIINKSNSVRLRWINGAAGLEKELLFQESQIFVLPTRYKTEAQPIVILEALATGSAVITTRVGEIATTLTEETAVFLNNYSPNAIAKAIEDLSKDSEKRSKLVINGIRLFQERFSYTSHIEKWEKLFNSFYI